MDQLHIARLEKLARDHKRMSLIYGIGIVLVSAMAMYMFNVSWMRPTAVYSGTLRPATELPTSPLPATASSTRY